MSSTFRFIAHDHLESFDADIYKSVVEHWMDEESAIREAANSLAILQADWYLLDFARNVENAVTFLEDQVETDNQRVLKLQKRAEANKHEGSGRELRKRMTGALSNLERSEQELGEARLKRSNLLPYSRQRLDDLTVLRNEALETFIEVSTVAVHGVEETHRYSLLPAVNLAYSLLLADYDGQWPPVPDYLADWSKTLSEKTLDDKLSALTAGQRSSKASRRTEQILSDARKLDLDSAPHTWFPKHAAGEESRTERVVNIEMSRRALEFEKARARSWVSDAGVGPYSRLNPSARLQDLTEAPTAILDGGRDVRETFPQYTSPQTIYHWFQDNYRHLRRSASLFSASDSFGYL